MSDVNVDDCQHFTADSRVLKLPYNGSDFSFYVLGHSVRSVRCHLFSLFSVFFHNEGFENVALFDIVEFFKTDTAFVTGSNFLDVILETLE